MRKILGVVAAVAISATPAFASTGFVTVPEPTSIALTSVGMAMVGAMAWKRNRKK